MSWVKLALFSLIENTHALTTRVRVGAIRDLRHGRLPRSSVRGHNSWRKTRRKKNRPVLGATGREKAKSDVTKAKRERWSPVLDEKRCGGVKFRPKEVEANVVFRGNRLRLVELDTEDLTSVTVRPKLQELIPKYDMRRDLSNLGILLADFSFSTRVRTATTFKV